MNISFPRKKSVSRTLLVAVALTVVSAAPATAAPSAPAKGAVSFVVNGTPLSDLQQAAVTFLAERTYPGLAGEREARLDTLATVGWWSLKEGVFSLEEPLSYSNCHFPDGDLHIGPTESCADSIWQVGIAGLQVHNQGVDVLESTATARYPGRSVDEILQLTLDDAGFPASSSVAAAVQADQGNLRKSWLARNHLVAVTLQAPFVANECFTSSGCFSKKWEESALFAADRQTAERARSDLRETLAGLTTGSTDPEPDPSTITVTVLDLGGELLNVRATPALTAPVVGSVMSGQQIAIDCQADGPEVHNDVDGYTSTLWDRIPALGGYVSDAWVLTGHDGRIPGLGDC